MDSQKWRRRLWGHTLSAAGVVLVAGLSLRKPTVEVAGYIQVETRMAAAGFQPMEDGAVTVVRVGAKQ